MKESTLSDGVDENKIPKGIDTACMNDAPIMVEFKGVTVEITNDFRTGKIIVEGTANDVILHRDSSDFFPADNDGDILLSSKKQGGARYDMRYTIWRQHI